MPDLYTLALLFVFAAGVVVFLLLFFISAPYGRHSRGGWGPEISSRLSWVIMECPSVLFFAAVYSQGQHSSAIVPLVLLTMWQAHYIHRTFIYPLRMYKDGSNKTPFSVALMGATFNLINSYLNAWWISELGEYELSWLWDPRFLVGASMFVVGYFTNRWADEVLRKLKAQGKGYQIPRGGLYEKISCPNYFGELVQWTGWAIMTWSLAGVSFAFFTATNLVPRAITHHKWYREKFPDYPKQRKAIVPFVW